MLALRNQNNKGGSLSPVKHLQVAGYNFRQVHFQSKT